MADVDDMLANIHDAINLPDGAIPTHCIVLVEYAEPEGDEPKLRRMCTCFDDDLPVWTARGMLAQADSILSRSVHDE